MISQDKENVIPFAARSMKAATIPPLIPSENAKESSEKAAPKSRKRINETAAVRISKKKTSNTVISNTSLDLEPNRLKQDLALPHVSSGLDENLTLHYRMELGSILSQQAELRVKEKRIRQSLKKIHRMISITDESIGFCLSFCSCYFFFFRKS
jgi:regulator of replication initiation timing